MDTLKFITLRPKASKKDINKAFKMFDDALTKYGAKLEHYKKWEMFEGLCGVFEYMKGQPATEISEKSWDKIVLQEINPNTAIMGDSHDSTNGKDSSSRALLQQLKKEYVISNADEEAVLREVFHYHDDLVLMGHKEKRKFELILSSLGIKIVLL